MVVPPEAACIAVAGPVIQNKVDMTNRNWVVDGAEVRHERKKKMDVVAEEIVPADAASQSVSQSLLSRQQTVRWTQPTTVDCSMAVAYDATGLSHMWPY